MQVFAKAKPAHQWQRALAVGAAGLVIACFAACAPKPVPAADPSSAQEPDAPVMTVAWSATTDCSVCHAEQHTADAGNAEQHRTNNGFVCTTCHTDEASLVKAHADMTGKLPMKLKATAVDAALCTAAGCHNTAELGAATKMSTVLVDNEGTVVNPHALPENEEHAKSDCLSCHKGHSEEPMQKTAEEFCVSCHHEGTFECGTCHT